MVCTIKEKSKRTQLWPLCMKFRTHLRDEITVYWLKKKKKKNYKKDLPSSSRQQNILIQSTATPAISEPLHIAVLISQFKRYIHTARV